ncbi:Maf family protein [Cohnella luojiensis]|uniref:dTTP/UTP pyrophosphatase n=1 Tax=Cohnella luojiensis TaxID=652876 RepID=A0A4Y8M9R6_9BACL|nr:Maf family protein [Cohnella luojiensis]TFE30697.1 septum formation inhibitor Maf [Cohnella luojiensis]
MPSAATQLVLASASPRRQELIALLGLPIRILPSHVEEDTPEDWTPSQIVEGLSLRKALAVKEKLTNPADVSSIIVGSDTIVVLNGKVMGKPRDEHEARLMLEQLSGNTHEVFTGVTCVRISDAKTVTSHRVTKVRMRSLSAEQISRYVDTGEPMDKAGAYGIQEIGSLLIESIEGCYFNVVGLPVSLLAVQLEQFDIKIP